MLPVKIRRVFLAQHRIDFRRRFDGLLAEAYRLGANPYEGDCVVFVKKDHRQMRIIIGDGLGLYLISRRFEGSRMRILSKFAEDPSLKQITTGEVSMLLEGATYTVHKRARAWQKQGGEQA